jgi:hypothetical protein
VCPEVSGLKYKSRAKRKMLQGIYSAIFGEVNVSISVCVEIKGDYIEIKGDYIEIKGDYIEIKGDCIEIKGDYIEIKGDNIKKIAKLFYFCHLKKIVRPETFGPTLVCTLPFTILTSSA